MTDSEQNINAHQMIFASKRCRMTIMFVVCVMEQGRRLSLSMLKEITKAQGEKAKSERRYKRTEALFGYALFA